MTEAIEKLKTSLKDQVVKSSLYKNISAWYLALNQNDQKIVKVLLSVVAVILVYAWVWQPSVQANQQAQTKLASETRFHAKMKENAYRFTGQSNNTAQAQGSILSSISNTAKAKGIELRRFEPDGNNRLRIWLDKAEFDAVIDWIELLESEQGILVEQISLDKVTTGRVNVRAVFTI